jgi:glycosyltransferase involved in cell wall biosynthesis
MRISTASANRTSRTTPHAPYYVFQTRIPKMHTPYSVLRIPHSAFRTPHSPPSSLRVVFGYPFCTLGGCETVLSTRLRQLHARGIAAHAMFLGGGDGLRLFADLGDWVSVCRTPEEIEAKLAAIRPDILVSLDTPQIGEYLARCPAGTQFIYEVHSTYPEALRHVRRMLQYHPAALLTPSAAQRDLVLSILGGGAPCPVRVVPNPLPPSFQADPAPPPAPRPVVVWVGRLDPHKNWQGFLEICRKVHHRRPDAEYWVVGTSKIYADQREQLWKTVKSAGLSARFRWLPHVPYDRMDRLMRFVGGSGGCLVSTSRQESFGMVAAEAMACRCPVVVPEIGGFLDFVVPGRTGFLYPPGRTDIAADCVVRLIQDLADREQIVEAGCRHVQEHYSAPNAVAELAAVLTEIKNASQVIPDAV